MEHHSGSDARTDISVAAALFFVSAFLLTCLGILAVHTSSITTRQDGFEPIYLTKHFAHLAVGAVLCVLLATRRASSWQTFALVAGFAVVVALALVQIPGVGLSAGGATRWLKLPGFSVQPSEWAKVTVPLLVCYALRQRSSATLESETERERRRSRAGRCVAIALVLASIALTLKQPDLGTAVLLAMAAVVAAWLSGLKLRYFVAAGVALVPTAAVVSLRGYQMRRITGLVETWRDWHAAPYQLKQSLIALGEGGVGGVGLGRGWQKLSFLPESHTDFVIAVVGEELGLVGILAVAALWITLFLSGLRLVRHRAGTCLGSFAATLLAMLTLQAALNVAVVSAVIPPTGIPHPFLSYGGNSLLVTATVLGICWSVARPPRSSLVSSRVVESEADTATDLARGAAA